MYKERDFLRNWLTYSGGLESPKSDGGGWPVGDTKRRRGVLKAASWEFPLAQDVSPLFYSGLN